MKELNIIQTKLVAPKDKRNQFGGFDYRSLEDICEAVRPLLKETNCTLTFSDDLVYCEGRFYIKSTARITNSSGEFVEAVGFAREADSKKGMDEAQVTGLSSSYARKYACCSLLCVSGAKDYDEIDNTTESAAPKTEAKPKTKAKAAQPTESTAKKRLTAEMIGDPKNESVKQVVAWVAASKSEDEYNARLAQVTTKFNMEEEDVKAFNSMVAKVAEANNQ